MSKIIDKITKAQEEQRIFYSFEYFPPKTPSGCRNLYSRLDVMAAYQPEWIDVTWGAGGSTAETTLEICSNAQNFIGLETMMHLTCTNIDRGKVLTALEAAKKAGIKNILALRGDPPRGEKQWTATEGGFAHAIDLVKFIRETHGDHFGICVAGYPELHPDSGGLTDDDVKHLKNKVEAGADIIITQLFYDVTLFIQFVARCRAAGIKCPILPGMMPIQTYAGFSRMTTLCKTHVPQFIWDALEPIKNDDALVKDYGVKLCTDMCRQLLEAGTPGLHFYTLNLEKSVLQIIDNLGLSRNNGQARALPWRSSALNMRKSSEHVRPIFWSNRPTSYMSRTSSWDDFPNGRWGDSRSPAYGEINDYHLTSNSGLTKQERRALWGDPKQESDVFNIFAKFCRGELNHLPWNDAPLSLESEGISSKLVLLNEAGYLTINSQPAVNGADSSDVKYGWGGSGGVVYQKAYVEFFAAPEKLKLILDEVAKGELGNLGLVYTNAQGEGGNVNLAGPTAVTWGVFPGKEIVQPTVVDPEAFKVWKDEAFSLWKNQWAKVYETENAESHKLILNMHDNYYLIAVVDNDYRKGSIFTIFERIFQNAHKTSP